MDIALYEVSPSGRVSLGDLANGVKYFKAEKPNAADGYPAGTVILTPVNIVSASSKRTAAEVLGEQATV